MTQKQKEDIIKGISLLLDGMVEEIPADIPGRCRMLTIRECSEEARGISQHTIRLLVKRGELPSIRTGNGERGKILVPERALQDYISRISR